MLCTFLGGGGGVYLGLSFDNCVLSLELHITKEFNRKN